MPARNEPGLAGRSRSAPNCARWLGRWLIVCAASGLAGACFLNPKTDDLPGDASGDFPGPPFGGSADEDPSPLPDVPGLGSAPDFVENPADNGEPDPTRDVDAGAALSADAGGDAE
jgi:hypothetical protein